MDKSVQLNVLVCKYFMRVVKEVGLHGKFKERYSIISSNRNGQENPFCGVKDFNDLSEKLRIFTFSHSMHNEHHKNLDINDHQYVFHVVTDMINHLLHFFLEGNDVRPDKLGKYGQMIFDLVCNHIYGD